MICQNGNHSLEVIYEFDASHDSQHVVRWCNYCGAVVVDIDYDNRTNPGAIQKMKFPQLLKEIVNSKNSN